MNKNGQVLVEKTRLPSTSHPYAKIWKARCSACGTMYGLNSCDFHIRRCPNCQGGEPGEPMEPQAHKDRLSEDFLEDEIEEPPDTGFSPAPYNSPMSNDIGVLPTPETTEPASSEAARSAGNTRPTPEVSGEEKTPPSLLRRSIMPFMTGGMIGLLALASMAYYLEQQPEMDLVGEVIHPL